MGGGKVPSVQVVYPHSSIIPIASPDDNRSYGLYQPHPLNPPVE